MLRRHLLDESIPLRDIAAKVSCAQILTQATAA